MTPDQVPVGPSIHFLNVAYFFQLLYNLVFSAHAPALSLNSLADLATTLWFFYTLLSYLFCLVCIGLTVYFSTRMYQAVHEEAQKYTTISKEEADSELEHSRWSYIKGLIESPQQSDWRQAIIEADIMLDELLTKLGYLGNSVGDKLKMANPSTFHSIRDAWDAHMVRNDIAHRGSEFELADNIAYRTISLYENVFREFNEI